MSPHSGFEARVAAALLEQAESAQHEADTDVQLARLQRAMSRDRSRLRAGLAVVAAAAAVAVVVGATVVGGYVGGSKNPTHHNASRFPKLQGLIAAAPLPASAVTTSGALDGTAAPELVTAGALWSVQNVGSYAFVLRSDPVTLRTISTTRFSVSPVHWQVSQLARVGDVVVIPLVGWRPPGAVGGVADGSIQSAIVRFDAHTGRLLTPLLVNNTGVDVATPIGVFVEIDVNTLGLLDPTATRIVRRITMPFDDAVVYASGLLWGFDVETRKLVGVDPLSGRLQRTFPTPNVAEAHLLPAGSDALLVLPRNALNAPTLGTYRFDTRALRLTSGTEYGGGSGNGPTAWAAVGDRLWTAYGGLLVEFDAKTFRMLHSYSVGDTGLNDTGFNVVVPVAAGRMFVSDSASNQLHSFDLTRLH